MKKLLFTLVIAIISVSIIGCSTVSGDPNEESKKESQKVSASEIVSQSESKSTESESKPIIIVTPSESSSESNSEVVSAPSSESASESESQSQSASSSETSSESIVESESMSEIESGSVVESESASEVESESIVESESESEIESESVVESESEVESEPESANYYVVTVSYKMTNNGQTTVITQTVKEGDSVTINFPSIPVDTSSDYVFNGWIIKETGVKYDKDTKSITFVVTGNVTIETVFTKQYTGNY